jgi:hypothetical protein
LVVTGDTTALNDFGLLVSSDFIIKGKIVGVDSAYCEPTPVFEISDWAPTTYSPNFWTFGLLGFILYILTVLFLTIFSIAQTVNYKNKK